MTQAEGRSPAGGHDIALFDDRLGGCDGPESMREVIAPGCRAPLNPPAGQAGRGVTRRRRAGDSSYEIAI